MILFVVAWLVAVYIYDVVREHTGAAWSLAAAVASFAVNAYARYRAVRSATRLDWEFSFWLALPMVIFFVGPLVVGLVAYWRSAGEITWWELGTPLVPPILKLVVPTVALLWIYWMLGRGEKRAPDGGSAEAQRA
jgi:hypothetical protein